MVADFATYSALRTSLYNQVDQQLAHQPPRLVAERGHRRRPSVPSPQHDFGGAGPVGDSGGAAAVPAAMATAASPTSSASATSRVVNQNGAVVQGLECPAYVGDHPYRPQLPSPITGFTTQPDGTQVAYFTTGSIASGGPAFRVRATKIEGQLRRRHRSCRRSRSSTSTSTLHTLFLTELAVTAGALVLALAGGWWLVRLGLRPLEDVERTADSIAAGNLDQRVPGADQATEVGPAGPGAQRHARADPGRLLAPAWPSEARLKENEQHLRQFVADASHELRTPIAAVSAYAELFERGGAEHADDLPRIVSGIRTETARMDRLVNDLLTLARLDEGVPMEMAPVELVALASDAVRTATAVGPRVAGAVLGRASGRGHRRQGPPAPGPRQPAGQRPGAHAAGAPRPRCGWTRSATRPRSRCATPGPGMPDEEARRVFERFYRADPARARTSGGSGLGLSIVAAIVAAHGGTVSAASAPGEGMTVTVRPASRSDRRATAGRDEPTVDPSRASRPESAPPDRGGAAVAGTSPDDSHRVHSRASRSPEAAPAPCLT